MQFNPKPGDTIVTAEGLKYTCVPQDKDTAGADFFGVSTSGLLESWMTDGRTETETLAGPLRQRLYWPYRAVKIIPAVQAQESTLEFRIRVFEKENQMLTRLLMKEGKL